MGVAVDMLSGVSWEWLKALTWLSSIVSGLILYFWRPHRLHLAALGAVIVFIVSNLGAGVYVIYHPGDARWNGSAEDRLNAPSLSDTPVVGQFLGSLDAVMSEVVDGVNSFIDYREALPVALEFFAAAAWGLVVSLPLVMLALMVSYADAKRRRAEFITYKLQIDELRAELDELKRQLGHPKRI